MFASQDGHPVAINYGSAAGELAVCVRAVGLVDRSDLVKLEVEGPPAQLSGLIMRLAGGTLSPGGALFGGAVSWCGSSSDRVLALCEPRVGDRLYEHLRLHSLHHAGLSVRDRSADWAAIELLGRNAFPLLRSLGAYGDGGDPREVPPFAAGAVAGIEVRWLHRSDRHALALVARERAAALWRAIENAGRPFGLSCVGSEAARRYALLERIG